MFPTTDSPTKYHLPVIFHTGDNWSTTAKVKYAHPLRMDEVAVDHPEVRFVLAHFGNPWLIDAAEVVFKNPNVWADLSGLFVGSDKEIQDLLDAAGLRFGCRPRDFRPEKGDRLMSVTTRDSSTAATGRWLRWRHIAG